MRLSLCIATRNRAHVITETIDALLVDLPESVEIVVLDGASSDETERVMGRYARRYSAIHYVRLESNGGVDLDYCRAVEHASGEFCWLMTDDDIVVRGGVEEVLRRIDDDVDLVIANAQVCNEDFSRVLQARRLECCRDQFFGPGEFEEFFRACAYYMSFIGSVIVRRSVWLARRRGPYLGTEFIHCGIIFQRPLDRAVRVIAEPIVLIRYGVAQWSSRAFQIWMLKWPRLIWSFDTVSDVSKRAVVPREPWRNPLRLLYYRARGQYSPQTFTDLLADKEFPLGMRVGAQAIAYVPSGIWCNAFALIAAIVLPQERMLQLDLQANPAYRKELTPVIERMSAIARRTIPLRRSLAQGVRNRLADRSWRWAGWNPS